MENFQAIYETRNSINSVETRISREIRVLAEVEKIWIQYDMDDNGELDYNEVSNYLQERAFPHLTMS